MAKLTAAEKRKVKRTADAIKRRQPGIATAKKFKIATAAVLKQRRPRKRTPKRRKR